MHLVNPPIAQSLKSNQDDPDPATAAAIGIPLGPDGMPAAGAGMESIVNQPAIDMLRRLPGVSDANYRAIMREAGSLAGLVAMPREALERVMGGAGAAKKLWDFMHGAVPPSFFLAA